MKKLTKVLSLVLVIAMVVSLCVVGVSAKAFTDSETIGEAYAEAVDVMSGVGIIDGMGDGNFAPTANFTRAQAAKIITYMQLGPTSAEALKGTASGFSDVAATDWFAPYVAYCAQQGVIAGYGNGKFGPNDTLTGYQFAKMLLVAVGYGANKEYVGSSWSINVAKDALNKGVFADVLSASTNEVITREQATQMAFNTLTKINKVTYSPIVSDYVDNSTFLGGTSTQAATLGQMVYGLTIYTGVVTGVQASGNTTATVAYNKVNNDTATPGNLTLFTNVELGKLYNAVNVYTNGKTAKTTQVVYAVVGKGVSATYTVSSASVNTLAAVAKAAGFSAASQSYFTKNDNSAVVAQYGVNYGALNTVVPATAAAPGDTFVLVSNNTNGTVDYMIKVAKSLEKVAFVKTATDTYGVTTDTYKLSSDTYYVTSDNSNTTMYTDSKLAKDDYVITTVVGSMLYVEPATTVTAKITSVSKTNGQNTSIVAGGKTYTASAVADLTSLKVAFAALGTTTGDVKLVLDTEGKCVGSTDAAATVNFGYVAAVDDQGTTTDPNFGSAVVNVDKALVYFVDGTHGFYKTYASAAAYAAGTTTLLTEGQVYNITAVGTDSVIATQVTEAKAAANTYTTVKGASAIGYTSSGTKLYANDKTVIFYATGSYDATKADFGFSVTPVVGYANILTNTTIVNEYYAATDATTLVVATANQAYAAADNTVVYYTGNYSQNFDGTNYTTTYEVYLNGAKVEGGKTYSSTTAYPVASASAGVYIYGTTNLAAAVKFNADSATTTSVYNTATISDNNQYSGNILWLGNQPVVVTAATPIVDVTAAGNSKVAALSDFNDIGALSDGYTYGSIDITVTYAYNTTVSAYVATAIYVTDFALAS